MANGQITSLLNTGMDAFTNLWDVQITFPTNVITDSSIIANNFSVRAVSFNPPELTISTTNVDYKGVQLTRLTPKIQGERTFTLEFRMDSTYDLYQYLLKWKHIWVDPSGEGNIRPGGLADFLGTTTGSVAGDGAKYGTIKLQSYSSETSLDGYSAPNTVGSASNLGALWQFYDVICTKVGSPTYQRANSDFVTISSEFIFGRIIEPYSSGSFVYPQDTSLIGKIPVLT